MTMSSPDQNLPIHPESLASLSQVIESDPNYWSNQLFVDNDILYPDSWKHQHEQAESTSSLLPDANISQDFTVISNFLKDRWDAEPAIPPDRAANSPPGNSYSPSIGIDPANLNVGSSDELVTSFQAGYHVSHNGTILPIFVSTIYNVNQNLRTNLGIRITRVLESGYVYRTCQSIYPFIFVVGGYGKLSFRWVLFPKFRM